MIEGIEVELDGKTYTVAPLNFRAIEKFAPALQKIQDAGFKMSDVGVVRDIIASSLRRNHPELTDDFLLDHLDLKSAPMLLGKVLIASGAGTVATEDEGTQSGEAKPIA